MIAEDDILHHDGMNVDVTETDDVATDVAVDVTEAHLESGGSKTLSVSDLVDAMRLEAVEIEDGPPTPPSVPPPVEDPPTTSSESTITPEFPAAPPNEQGK